MTRIVVWSGDTLRRWHVFDGKVEVEIEILTLESERVVAGRSVNLQGNVQRAGTSASLARRAEALTPSPA